MTNISTDIRNNRADKEQPCLMPRAILKYSEFQPLFVMQLEHFWYIHLIIFMK